MTAAVDARARVVVPAIALLLLVTAVTRSEVALPRSSSLSGDGPATGSAPAELVTAFGGSAIATVPVDVVPASDRPVVAGAKRGDGQRAPSLPAAGAAAAATSAPLAWDLPLHGSLTSVGPVALGLTRRGPPTTDGR